MECAWAQEESTSDEEAIVMKAARAQHTKLVRDHASVAFSVVCLESALTRLENGVSVGMQAPLTDYEANLRVLISALAAGCQRTSLACIRPL
eukprot:3109615-Rhodomonas_salina.3